MKKSETAEIRRYEIRTPWIQVEVWELRSLVSYLTEQTPLIISRYGENVRLQANDYLTHLGTSRGARAKLAMNIASDLRGRKLAQITIRMPSTDWETGTQAAQNAEVRPSDVVRYGLRQRFSSLRRFHESQKKEATA